MLPYFKVRSNRIQDDGVSVGFVFVGVMGDILAILVSASNLSLSNKFDIG